MCYFSGMFVLSPLIGVSSLFIVLCSYIYLLMYAGFHSRSDTLYQAGYFLYFLLLIPYGLLLF